VLPKKNIIASHLFRRENHLLAKQFVSLDDIDDPRNGLLLIKPIEHEYDHHGLIFVMDDKVSLVMKILNPALRSMKLKDHPFVEQSTISYHGMEKTFGDFEGKKLKVPTGPGQGPSKICLHFQAVVSRHFAIDKNWISSSFQIKKFASESDIVNADQIDSWLSGVTLDNVPIADLPSSESRSAESMFHSNSFESS
jgi:hypothetical protein